MPAIAALGSIFFLLLAASLPNTASAQAEGSLAKCQGQIGIHGANYIKHRAKAISTCLKKVAIEVIQKNAPDVSKATNTCVAQFRKLKDTRAIPKDKVTKFLAKIDPVCDPATNPHTLADMLGAGAGVSESIQAENIGNWCGGFGGSGAITTYPDWKDCILAAHDLAADTVASVQYPRMLEWLDAVRPFIAAVTPPASDPTKVSDALAGLDEVNDADLEGLSNDDVPIGQMGTDLPASGQTTSFVPGDDGDIGAGAALRYVDNGDGTITDLNTGLMWEKKVVLNSTRDATNLNDADNCYPWQGKCSTAETACGTDADCLPAETCKVGDCQLDDPNGVTIFGWVAALNAAAFAGYTDWRIPHVKELQGVADYGASSPTIDAAFHGASCGGACTDLTDPQCSCTASDEYWSSTSVVGNEDAWKVKFEKGKVETSSKESKLFVRAVRGGR